MHNQGDKEQTAWKEAESLESSFSQRHQAAADVTHSLQHSSIKGVCEGKMSSIKWQIW